MIAGTARRYCAGRETVSPVSSRADQPWPSYDAWSVVVQGQAGGP